MTSSTAMGPGAYLRSRKAESGTVLVFGARTVGGSSSCAIASSVTSEPRAKKGTTSTSVGSSSTKWRGGDGGSICMRSVLAIGEADVANDVPQHAKREVRETTRRPRNVAGQCTARFAKEPSPIATVASWRRGFDRRRPSRFCGGRAPSMDRDRRKTTASFFGLTRAVEGLRARPAGTSAARRRSCASLL